jgi:predicted AlkP superfamily pyrophosphatase or phosphodiesterase
MIRALSLFFTLLISNSVYAETVKSTVVLLSVDGFSYDYLQKYKPKNILNFAKSGVSAPLLPVYPSKTFPNHLSIITGAYPVNHGIIHNRFYHPELNQKYHLSAGKENATWITADPFWSVAEENSIKSAVYFWPESQALGHTPPTYNIPYNKIVTNKARFKQLIKWLKLPSAERPHFLVGYFSTVDSAGHHYGIDSPQITSEIRKFDVLFGDFLEKISNEIDQPINIILVSDHGMTPIKKEATIFTEATFKYIDIKSDGITVTYSDTQLFFYFDKTKVSKETQLNIEKQLKLNQLENEKPYSVYSKGNYPERWHFNADVEIVPNIILEAKAPASFSNKANPTVFNGATHGYDPKYNRQLDGLFIAAGTDITQNKIIKPFQNIHIFPLMNKLLGLKEHEGIDGKQQVLESIIK